MRVFHFVDSMHPSQGGPPNSVSGLASAEAGVGCDVTVAWRSRPSLLVNPAEAFGEKPDIQKVKWRPYVADGLDVFRSRHILRQVSPGSDLPGIVHVHGMWRPELLTVIRHYQRMGVPYIITLRGMLAPWTLKQKRLKKLLGLALGWRSALQNATRIHALNSDEAEKISAVGLTSRICVVPNGIYVDHGASATEPFRLPSGRPYILFLGRLHQSKGLDILAKAFAILSVKNTGVDLVVVGPDGGYRGEFIKLLHELGIQSRVHVVGPKYGTERYGFFAGALCLCHPSYSEGFSMAILEALSFGLPVVVSEACNFPEVREWAAGDVVSNNPEDMAHALRRLVVSKDVLLAAGAAAKSLVRERYEWPAVARTMIGVYSECGAL